MNDWTKVRIIEHNEHIRRHVFGGAYRENEPRWLVEKITHLFRRHRNSANTLSENIKQRTECLNERSTDEFLRPALG